MRWYHCTKCNEWYKEEEAKRFGMTCQDCDMELVATCPKCLKPEKECKCGKKK